MQAAFTLPQPMLPATATAGTTSVGPAACSRVSMQSVSASPGAVAPGAEGLCNLLPYTGQHIASLCSQAVTNHKAHAAADAHNMVLLESLFPHACMQCHCVKCLCSVDVTHNFSKCMLHEHRTGDGSYMPCSSTLQLYAMLKLLHNVASFDLLQPSVELNKMTLHADVAYCMHINELEDSCNRQQCIVEGTWLSTELLTWGGPVDNSTRYEVCVFKAGVNLYMPSDSTQLTMPNKEQLWLEVCAAKESWL